MPRESRTNRRQRALRISQTLQQLYPAKCALTHESPFQLLIATILSAQCTDERVNLVTPALFAKYKDAKDFAGADPADVESIIRSTGFFRAKTRHIIAASRALEEKHGGEIPRSLEELTALDGIGRKTANVVLGTAFGLASGVVVDTHVGRLARRMRLTSHADPVKVESDLMELLPQTQWIEFSHRMIWHGRAICLARRPRCESCPLVPDCPGSRDYLPLARIHRAAGT
ncbi:MAG: endonuclease III [candidate division Zixibacteria bacterium]|nr:endonuclease III [candidate division Zixibacteria bacterium]